MHRAGLLYEDYGGVIHGGFEVCDELLGELNEAGVEGVGLNCAVASELLKASQFVCTDADGDSPGTDD